jgi:hypothetical protein
MIKGWPVGSLFGLLAVMVYVCLTLAACLQYPGSYSPLAKSLSDLGDSTQNPSGATLYNTGGILLGTLLVPFYLSLRRWNTGDRILKILVIGAQAVGLLSSVGLVLSCVFPLGINSLAHGAWAGEAFFFSIFFWIFSAFAQLRNPGAIKWMAYFGLLPLTMNIVVPFIPGAGLLGEWFSVSLFLVYVVLLAYNTRIMARHNE